MNNYGVIIDHMGLYECIQDVVNVMNNATKWLFPLWGGGRLDSVREGIIFSFLNFLEHHAFVVEYEIGKDEDLDLHMDKSEITVNLCLGREFEGGEVHFQGVRDSRKQDDFLYTNVPGRAAIHGSPHSLLLLLTENSWTTLA